MLEATELLRSPTRPGAPAPGPLATLTLSFDQRRKSRYRTRTDCGLDLGWFLPRGIVLAEGDRLLCSDGMHIQIKAADEEISEIHCDNALLVSRAAYHLGNRHVPLDIAEGRLRYQRDSVLDDMLAGLGLEVRHTQAPFNPENGAYHGHGGHGHVASDDSRHEHSHAGAAHDHSHGQH